MRTSNGIPGKELAIYSGPQWYYKWLQSADNSTDGDTRHDLFWICEVDNAAAALCLDYLRRHGKGNWIRDELYWNYLFSNKNCARVWFVLFGIASPLGYLSLCLGYVGFLCTYFLMTNGDPKFAYQTTSKWVWNLFNLCKWMFNFFKLCKWTVDLCFCFAAAVVAIPCVVLLVVLCVALYQSVRSVMCLVTYASLGALYAILGATIKTICFIWTPFTTTVSVGCQHSLIFVSGYRDFLRKLLDFASPIVRDHYSAPPPPSDACEPCDGYSPMPWKIRVYRNLHLASSLHDDALAALYARL